MSALRRQRRSWRSEPDTGASRPPSSGDEASHAGLPLILERLARSDAWWRPEERRKAEGWTDELEERYRRLYQLRDWDGDHVGYEEARAAYRVGRLAADHPGLGTRPFDEVAPELGDGWDGGEAFERVRRYVELGFRRRRYSVELMKIRTQVDELERRLRQEA